MNGAEQANRNNEGIVMFDVPEDNWKVMSVQQQMLFITHNLIDFMTQPAFMVFQGFRMQVKQTGIILPMHVPLALGKQPMGVRLPGSH